tara:strand:+ start:4931 stop:5596 length:666 start_codon:yes stop_codon:yes gene_type:complete
LNNTLNRQITDSIGTAFNYKLSNIKYFKSALTHKSTSTDNYERLEILGDSILQILITEILYFKYPSYNEGEITVSRQNLVNSRNLGEIFKTLNLVPIFNKINPKFLAGNIYADLFEAIVGALYLDSNFEEVKKIINSIFIPLISEDILEKDSKTILQEFLHSKKIKLPIYKTVHINNSKFKYLISCEVEEVKIKESTYANKVKPAEQKLASIIYKKINENI